MGVLCSTVDKTEDEPTEGKAQNQPFSHTSHRLHKMPRFVASAKETRSAVRWEERILKGGEYVDVKDYDKARAQLQLAEKHSNFDAEIASNPLDYEEEAAELVRKIRMYDWQTTYGVSHDDEAHPKKPRPGGDHFLGNVDLINETELFKVAKKMPKGAHLHVHFNSCLSQEFLIQQARDVEAMYIKSNVRLTQKEPKSFVSSRIAFNVMTRDNATKYRDAKGVESRRPLGDIFDVSYIPDTWMSYRDFQRRFRFRSESGQILIGTDGAETWLAQKMLISEEEAHGVHQTSHG
jgi:adenosine deaminase CECR1